MNMKFSQTYCPCLRRVVDQIQTQEQTQEVRLPEAMPDIGRVLGAWGKVMIRSKEWRNGGMGVSGGVMAWAMYVPEDGGAPQSIECWIPFQMKWEFPETERDGFIRIVPALKSIDARSTSARKMMVRANISLLGQGLETRDAEVFSPVDVPEDVQLLKNSYPMELPVESGEKLFQIDDELDLSGLTAPIDRILRYDLTPVSQEQRVMSSRLVFRGQGNVHLVYLSDGKIMSFDTQVPFSQYTDLDREYGPNATAQITPIVTNLEIDRDEGKIEVEASIAAQYVIYDRQMVELTEDAYSPRREVTLEGQQLQLPTRLDQRTEPVSVVQTMNAEAVRIADGVCMFDLPRSQQSGDSTEMVLPGQFQILYYDPEGNLQCGTARFEERLRIGSDADTDVEGMLMVDGGPKMSTTGQQVEISVSPQLQLMSSAQRGQWMVTGLDVGELRQPDPGRPSLILRRLGDDSLWDIAKASGSTEEAIRNANQLTDVPEKGRILLIPVT